MQMFKTCPVCHGTRIRMKKRIDKYRVLECRTCGLFWVPGVGDDELTAFYGAGYFHGSQEFGYNNYLGTEKVQRLNAARLVRTIAGHARSESGLAGSKLLDIGCAYGFLIDEACKAGIAAEGIDFSEEACRYARTILGRKAVHGTLHEANFPSGHFDIVVSIGSIEHLTDPVRTVDEVARITRPGGLFVVVTLDTKSLIRVFRFKPPEHLFYFSRHNLPLLLKSKGFVVETLKAYKAYHAVGETIGLLLKALLGPQLKIEPLIERLPCKSAHLQLTNNEMMIVARRL
jgi:2-polyprenyl-3-methyl-5-hydroxy-6-metoxy-1,4-benzoquinol methylase